MKKYLLIFALFSISMALINPAAIFAYDFGDYRSETLTSKAWAALGESDIEAVLAYTTKVIELYGDQAKKMQDSLIGYPEGTNQEIFNYWALNDVATCLYIQGEAYRKADMGDEAKEVYQKLIDEYNFGQCWDPKGWFWKPAEAAKEKLDMLESGASLDFGDYTSEGLTTKSWEALGNDDLEGVINYTDKVMELYKDKAKEMQASLTEYPWESNDKIFSYWALNDVGTCLFIKGEACRKAGETERAKEVFQELIDAFFYAQTWDPQGWFWKPSEAAQQKLKEF